MKQYTTMTSLMAAIVIGGSALTPVTAFAQRSRVDESHRRQEKKNEWRNIAIGSGVLSVLGLLRHDNTLTFAGAAGALYSVDRYEKDRKSQSKIDHARAQYFGKSYFNRDGQRYERRAVTKNGKRYYQFVRK